ncbi:hypothetical protein [Aestuariispira insulae]|uniref:TrbL/VirB6 plasmid conjugal transfer protein n=1 Tax=Aestuariispira insulae TaxID=1461337 RepID=A0A3D9H3T6_9PROT|nr:hypothetical protein [Aestuariispira insulae]RED44122.1 hypothetical protein DFP90_11725 [Aestuariispira insulae]
MECTFPDVFAVLDNAVMHVLQASFTVVGGTFSILLMGFFLLFFFYNLIKFSMNQMSGGDFTFKLVHEIGIYLLMSVLLGGGAIASYTAIDVFGLVRDTGPFIASKVLAGTEYSTEDVTGFSGLVCVIEYNFRANIFGALGDMMADLSILDSLQLVIGAIFLCLIYVVLCLMMIVTIFSAYFRSVAGGVLFPVSMVLFMIPSTRSTLSNNIRVVLDSSLRMMLCLIYASIILFMVQEMFVYFGNPKNGVAVIYGAGFSQALISGFLMVITYSSFVTVSGEILNSFGQTTNMSIMDLINPMRWLGKK